VEIDEVAARLVRRYWALLAICVVVPIIVVAVIVARQPALYSADSRIVTSSEVPLSSAAADGVVSQVQAIATGQTTVSQALSQAGARRNLGNFTGHDVAVAGLGTSQVIDLTVTDTNPRVAQEVSRTLARRVVSALNREGASGLAAALTATDAQIVRLSEDRAKLAAEVAAQPRNQDLQAKLAGLDQVIANFTGDRGRILIQASTQGLASVIDEPTLPVQPESKALAQKLSLAGLLGLVLGILLASIAETARPTVPGSRRVSRRLSAPTLGRLTDDDLTGRRSPAVDSLVLGVRLASSHAAVSTVALVDINGGRDLDQFARELEHWMQPASQLPAGGPAASTAENQNGHAEAVRHAGSSASTMVMDKLPAVQLPAIRVCPIAQIQRQSDLSGVGIVVLAGPVARLSRIAAVDDLVASSGWPILGVVDVPRLSKRSAARRGTAKVPGRSARGAAGPLAGDRVE
jgi:capsular polysaccharide biosynthesis protein